MSVLKFPVYVVQDSQGFFTATLLDGEEGSAIGDSVAEAVDRLRDLLEWRLRREGFLSSPEIVGGEVTELRVEVRPEYKNADRRHPCPETVRLRVPVISAQTEAGLPVALSPELGVRVMTADRETLRTLVNESIRQTLQGRTPQQLARLVAPPQVLLEQLAVRVKDRPHRRFAEPTRFPALETVADSLTDRALRSRYPRAWGRDAEIADLVGRVGRERANVLLVGETGVGKTTLLVDAARRIHRLGVTAAVQGAAASARKASGAAPPADDDDEEPTRSDDESADAPDPTARRFWLTSGPRLIAGMRYLGQWQERCEQIIEELAGLDGTLCVENLLDLVGTAGVGPSDGVAAFFLPYLQRGELRMVAEATPSELDACRRLLPGLAEVFQVQLVSPFARPAAIAVLEQVATQAARNTRVDFDRGVLETVHRLFARFQPYQPFPGPSTSFVTDLFDRAVRSKTKPPPPITIPAVLERFARSTGLPELFLRDDRPLSEAAALESFCSRVLHQDAACRAAANLVLTFKAGLNDPQRPLGVLLFCGPTGVGKTELARTLAQVFFGAGEDALAGEPTSPPVGGPTSPSVGGPTSPSIGGPTSPPVGSAEPRSSSTAGSPNSSSFSVDGSDRLIRLDMSEYAAPGSSARLLHGPDGDASEFIRRVRRRPFAVVLLDEIEKAHPEIFDLLLGVFDEGRITDRFGRVTTFRSAVLVMTSNLGATSGQAVGFGRERPPDYASEAARFFRPEFFNRLDAVVTFAPLSPAGIRAITEKELRGIASREGLVKLGLRLSWSDAVVDLLARRGFDARYGARPLQRTLEVLVTTPLARLLIAQPGLRNAEVALALDEHSELSLSVR